MDGSRDYGQDRELIKQFLKEYSLVDDDGQLKPKYADLLTSIANRESIHLYVDLSDMEQFNHELAIEITSNTNRYVQLFLEALDEILPSYKTKEPTKKGIMDTFIEQRLLVAERNIRAQQPNSTAPIDPTQSTVDPSRVGNADVEGKYPPDLLRRVEVSFKAATQHTYPIREVLAEQIGHLVTVRGLVTRVTDVKPRIKIAAYTCDQCGCETFQPVTDLIDFTPLFNCSSAVCKASKAPGRLTHQIRGSKFIKNQEIRLQELADEVPTGHIPRSAKVIAHGELTRLCNPGDIISVSGVYLPIERSSFRLRTGGLSADTYLEAHYIGLMSKSEGSELVVDPMSDDEAKELLKSGDFINRLSGSIAPEIFGHQQLKRALLLLLVGGVDKTAAGMKTRGNINICLMGDPGVAKSQLLGFIDRLALRSQYTTGRGSSGVGLTAAVLKDPITNEMLLEGGALVLADQGICCIDEFDKMMDSDRTAIHEVMEQQTVSIAKAGIMTTLNARVSVLAAANPAYGRYNIHKSVTDNLQLPPALLSRFDLLWLIKDEPRRENDLDLAQHVTYIHANPNQEAPTNHDALDMKLMRRYIALCKTKDPVLPDSLRDKFVETYLNIRQRKRMSECDDSLFTSPRSLLAIVRLATAHARLRLAETVDLIDLEEAVGLFNHSRASIEDPLSDIVLDRHRLLRLINDMTFDKPSKSIDKPFLIDCAINQLSLDSQQIEIALAELEKTDAIKVSDDSVYRC